MNILRKSIQNKIYISLFSIFIIGLFFSTISLGALTDIATLDTLNPNVASRDIEAISNSDVWLVGAGGNVFHMNGTEWVDHTPTPLTQWSTADINSVSATDTNVIWIAGASGNVWRSTDGGSNWTDADTLTGADWGTNLMRGVSALKIGSTNTAWVVGDGGDVWKYNGTTWAQEDGTGFWGTTNMYSVSVLSNKEVWISGASGQAWKCYIEDGWESTACTWTDASTFTGANWGTELIWSISAYSTNNVWMSGNNGHVWKYNGSAWTRLCGTGTWNASTETCDGASPVRWGTTQIRDVSDRYSTESWLVGSSGKVYEYNLPKWKTVSCDGADCSTNDDASINNITYSRNFYTENVCRATSSPYAITGITDNDGKAVGSPSSDPNYEASECDDSTGAHDPSTIKATVSVSWEGGDTITRSDYITRWQNDGCLQTKWSTASSTGVKICDLEENVEEYDTISPATSLNTESGNGTLKLANTHPTNPLAVPTGALTSAIFDTTEIGTSGRGAAFNSVTWLGTDTSADNDVRFMMATSDCDNGATNAPTCDSGTWDYKRIDTSCTSGDWVDLGDPGTTTRVRCDDLQNKRYFKYKIQLCASNCATAGASDAGPKIQDIIINWSP